MKYLLFALTFLLLPISADAVWFDSNWNYKVKLEVVPTKVGTSTAITSFPVYVDLSNLPAGFHTNVKSDGCDIRILESNEATETAFELVAYATSTDTGELHFMADSLATTSTSTFYMYYGNSGASCYAVTDTYGRNAVWSAYRAVYHLESLTADSTAQGYTLTNNGAVASAPGKIGNGGDTGTTNTTEVLNFSDGTNNFLTLNSAHTISYWINFNALPTGTNHVSQMMLFNFSSPNFRRYGHRYQGTNGFGFELVTAGLVWSGDTVSTSTWNHIIDTFNGTTLKTYLNGVEIQSLSHSFGTQFGGDNNLKRISIFGPNTTGELAGKMDDVRVKQAATTPAWIETEYNNQSSPSTFYVIGAQETNGGGGAIHDGGVLWFD